MTDDQNGSLADQAAVWVPPWQRTARVEHPGTGTRVEANAHPETAARSETDVTEPESVDISDVERIEGVELRPEADLPADTDSDTGSADDIDIADEQRPETDLLEPVPTKETGVAVESGVADVAGTPEKERADLRPALEAILLVVDEPVADNLIAQVLDVPTDLVTAGLIALAAEYTESGRGFDLRRAAGGWRLYTREEYSGAVERFVLDGQSVRLTQAALETLAVIAYQQPVTRSRMSAIRGVNCDGVVRTLVTRGLIEECGTQPESGAFLYRTTSLFLEKLGLNSVDDLPPLAPFLPDDVNGFADAQR